LIAAVWLFFRERGVGMKRVKRVEREPNPLFRGWLEEFRAEALRRDNAALVRLYDQCLTSLGHTLSSQVILILKYLKQCCGYGIRCLFAPWIRDRFFPNT